jgi:hypothetical protein
MGKETKDFPCFYLKGDIFDGNNQPYLPYSRGRKADKR